MTDPTPGAGTRFRPGDPRINRKGRPRTFDAARALTQQIGHEIATDAAGAELVIDGHRVTRIELILREWASSKNPKLQQAFMAYAVGEPPKTLQHEGKGGGPVTVRVVYDETDDAPDDLPGAPAAAA